MLEEKVVRRGEVWWVKSLDSFGQEYGSGRPAVVVSGDAGNKTSPTVIVVYTTTQRKPSMAVNVRVMVDGVPNVVMANAINHVDKGRLDRKICMLTESEMVRVGGALAVAMCIPQYSRPNATQPAPKESEDVTALRCEIDMWRKMYETTMDQLVELRVAQVVAQRTNRVVIVEAPGKKSEDVGLIVDDLVPETRVVKSALVEPDPGFEEESAPEEPKEPKVVWDGVKVNVNTVASGRELKRRTGMNTRTATEIVETRDAVGDYEKLEDLLALDHFGDLCMKRYGHMLTVVDEPAEVVDGTEKKKNSPE